MKALQQLLFPGASVEHSRLAQRLQQIADTLVASDAVECKAVHAEDGCGAVSANGGKARSTSLEAACIRAGTEDAEKQPSFVEDPVQTCRPPRNLGKGKKQRGVERRVHASSLQGLRTVNSDVKFADASRQFRMDAFRQHRVALEVYYLGWAYHGFASQTGLEATVEVPFRLLCSAAAHALSCARLSLTPC